MLLYSLEIYNVAENLLWLEVEWRWLMFVSLCSSEGCRAAHLCALTSSVPRGPGKGLPCALPKHLNHTIGQFVICLFKFRAWHVHMFQNLSCFPLFIEHFPSQIICFHHVSQKMFLFLCCITSIWMFSESWLSPDGICRFFFCVVKYD